jgi:hypothetical protein
VSALKSEVHAGKHLQRDVASHSVLSVVQKREHRLQHLCARPKSKRKVGRSVLVLICFTLISTLELMNVC